VRARARVGQSRFSRQEGRSAHTRASDLPRTMRGSAAIGFLLRWLSLSMIVAEVSPKICASVLSYVCVFLGSGYVLHTTDSGGPAGGVQSDRLSEWETGAKKMISTFYAGAGVNSQALLSRLHVGQGPTSIVGMKTAVPTVAAQPRRYDGPPRAAEGSLASGYPTFR